MDHADRKHYVKFFIRSIFAMSASTNFILSKFLFFPYLQAWFVKIHCRDWLCIRSNKRSMLSTAASAFKNILISKNLPVYWEVSSLWTKQFIVFKAESTAKTIQTVLSVPGLYFLSYTYLLNVLNSSFPATRSSFPTSCVKAAFLFIQTKSGTTSFRAFWEYT